MSTTIKTKSGQSLKVTLRDGDKPAQWDANQPYSHNHSRVTISTPAGRHTFDYWGNVQDYWDGKENDPLDAVGCFAGDALAGAEDFDEFCADFGYDEDSRHAHKIWKACRRSAQAAQGLGLTDDDLYALYDR